MANAVDIRVLADAVALVGWPEVQARIATAGVDLSCDQAAWMELAHGAAAADCGPVTVLVGDQRTHLSVHVNRDPEGAITVTHFELAAAGAADAWLTGVKGALAAAADEVLPQTAPTEYRFGSGRRALVLTPAGKAPVVQIGRRGAVR